MADRQVEVGIESNLPDMNAAFSRLTDIGQHLPPEKERGSMSNIGFGQFLITDSEGDTFFYQSKVGSRAGFHETYNQYPALLLKDHPNRAVKLSPKQEQAVKDGKGLSVAEMEELKNKAKKQISESKNQAKLK